MLMGWVDKMKLVWEHRGEIADEFLRKWNAENMWDRGQFQGDVLGWLMMTVLLILVTMGEDAPAAVAAIVTRWPQVVKLIKTVDTLGDVTTYLGGAAKVTNVSGGAASYVARKLGRARGAEHVVEDASLAGRKTTDAAEHASSHMAEDLPPVELTSGQQGPGRHTYMMNRSLQTVRSSDLKSTLARIGRSVERKSPRSRLTVKLPWISHSRCPATLRDALASM